MAETKPWYQSKTIWVNVLMFILTLAQSDLFLSFNLDPKIIAAVIGGVNFVLRLITTTPVTAKKQT